jgi:hypothetical protein
MKSSTQSQVNAVARVSPPKLGGVAASEASRRGGSLTETYQECICKDDGFGTTPSAPSARPPLLTQEGTPARLGDLFLRLFVQSANTVLL